jgi:hypothetical protein
MWSQEKELCIEVPGLTNGKIILWIEINGILRKLDKVRLRAEGNFKILEFTDPENTLVGHESECEDPEPELR